MLKFRRSPRGFMTDYIKEQDFVLCNPAEWENTTDIIDPWLGGITYLIEHPQFGVIGAVRFSIEKYGSREMYYMYLELLEIAPKYQNQGFGCEVVKKLLDYKYKGHPIRSIKGESYHTAIAFWYERGADFGKTWSALQKNIDRGYSAVFSLTKRAFEKYSTHQ